MEKGLIIGLTGKNASGKGEIAGYLMKEKGFRYYSLSDVIRDEMSKKGIPPSRDDMISFGNMLREKYGADILAKKVKKNIKGNSIVDSIRNTAEIRELRKLTNFILLGIDAPVALRFKRISKRNRIGDAKTLKEFILKEKQKIHPTPGINSCRVV